MFTHHRSSSFKATLLEPNGFYEYGGSVYVPPTVFVKVVSEKDPTKAIHSQTLIEPLAVPYRSLSYTMPKDVKQRDSCLFYGGRDTLPHRTQYEILVDSSYPCKDRMEQNYWGLKPPQ